MCIYQNTYRIIYLHGPFGISDSESSAARLGRKPRRTS